MVLKLTRRGFSFSRPLPDCSIACWLGTITSNYLGLIVITPNELERALRASCEPLKNVQVGYSSLERSQLAPELVTIGGTIYINGAVKAYEADIDLRSMNGLKDLEILIRELLKSFEMAKVQANN